MPFFANEKRVGTRSRSDGAVSIDRASTSSSRASSSATAKANSSQYKSGQETHYRQDDYAESVDYTLSNDPYINGSEIFDSSHTMSHKTRGIDRKVDSTRHRSKSDQTSQHHQEHFDTAQSAGSFSPNMNTSTHRSPPLYEHCLLLRKHGMNVKFGHPTAQPMAARQAPTRRHSSAIEEDFGVDVRNPSETEVQLITQAIACVLDCGGEIEIPAFPLEVTTPTPSVCEEPNRRPMEERHNRPRNGFQEREEPPMNLPFRDEQPQIRSDPRVAPRPKYVPPPGSFGGGGGRHQHQQQQDTWDP